MVGFNIDQWSFNAEIWFEKGTKNKHGAVFTGTTTKDSPEGGMNECGLAFGSLLVPKRKLKDQSNKKNGTEIYPFKKILYECKNIDQAYLMLSQYDLSVANGTMFFFIDKAGNYLIVEADTLIRGNNQKYVVSNFCPSQVTDFNSIKISRYRKGINLLNARIDTTISFCSSLSDSMHVCRPHVGDGTLYTTIYDLNDGTIYLHFYHDFKHMVKFNLKAELENNNNEYKIPDLFPLNTEYVKFQNYFTPQTNSSMLSLFLCFILLFSFSFIYFSVSFFKNRKKVEEAVNSYLYIKLWVSILSILMVYYLFVLKNNRIIFYFPAPYKEPAFSILNIAAYIPFLFLLLIIPLFILNVKVFKVSAWNKFSKLLFTLNNLTFSVLIILFAYWGLYNIF